MLAIQSEILHGLYRLMLRVHTEERTPLPEPFRYPRPYDEERKPAQREPATRHTYRAALLGGGKPRGL